MKRFFLIAMHLFTLCAAAQVHAQTADSRVDEQGIVISLGVYFTSLVAVAASTWTVAKYDSARESRIKKLESMLQELLDKQGDRRRP